MYPLRRTIYILLALVFGKPVKPFGLDPAPTRDESLRTFITTHASTALTAVTLETTSSVHLETDTTTQQNSLEDKTISPVWMLEEKPTSTVVSDETKTTEPLQENTTDSTILSDNLKPATALLEKTTESTIPYDERKTTESFQNKTTESIVLSDMGNTTEHLQENTTESTMLSDKRKTTEPFLEKTTQSIILSDKGKTTELLQENTTESTVLSDKRKTTEPILEKTTESIILSDKGKTTETLQENTTESIVLSDKRKTTETLQENTTESTVLSNKTATVLSLLHNATASTISPDKTASFLYLPEDTHKLTDLFGNLADVESPQNIMVHNITQLTDALSEIIAKQLTLCGRDSLCSLVDSSEPLEHIACCGECSCTPDCLAHRNCCVDYALTITNGNSTYSSLDELNAAMTNHTLRLAIGEVLNDIYMQATNESKGHNNDITDNIPVELDSVAVRNDSKDMTDYTTPIQTVAESVNTLPRPDDSTGITDTIECLSPQMLRSNGFSRPGKYYSVVTGCKKAGENLDSECFRNRSNSTQTELFDSIPVTSLRSGKTYRNRSVLECCDGDSGAFEYWDLFVVCRGDVEYLPAYFFHPLQLFTGATLPHKCHAVYELPNVPGLVPETCVSIDIKTCAMEAASARGLFLNQFCEQEQHFLRVTDHMTFTVYNNAACVLCNRGIYFTYAACQGTDDYGSVMKLRVNLDEVNQHRTTIGDLSDGGLLEIRALPNLNMYIDGCTHGHIFVPVLGECRRLYCPRSMYIVNGSCVPLYNHVTCASYKTALNMTILSSSPEDINEITFERAFVRFLNDEFFADASLYANQIRMRSFDRTYAIEMILTPNKDVDVTLNDVVRTVTRLYYTTVDIRVSRYAVIRLGISPGSSFYFRQTRPFSVDTNDVKDVKTLTNSSFELEHLIVISESFTCYRIGITQNSFILTGHSVQIPAQNTSIYSENMDFRASSEEMLVCVDVWFGRTRKFTNTDNVNRFLYTTSDEKDIFESDIFIQLVLVVIGVAVTLLCIVSGLVLQRMPGCLARWGLCKDGGQHGE